MAVIGPHGAKMTLTQDMDRAAHRIALLGIELFCIDLGNTNAGDYHH